MTPSDRPIPLLTARIPPGAADAVADVLRSGYIGGGGEVVQRFERELAAFLGADPACLVTTNSGTSALLLAYHLAGVRGGSALTPPMTFVATTTALYQAGSKAAWMDVGERSCVPGEVEIERVFEAAAKLASRFRRRSDVRAVVTVAWGGFLPALPSLGNLASTLRVPLILDAAQAIGARYAGLPVHDYADFTIYSFAPTKHLTTGDGGALVCRDPAVAVRARKLAWFGMRREVVPPERWPSDQDIAEAGFKLHMNNIAAALGLAGLPGLGAALDTCRRNAAYYRARFGPSQQDDDAEALPSPWTYTVYVDDPARFVEHMAARGVTAGQPHRRNDANAFAAAERIALPNTDWTQAHYCCIPVGWWVTEADAALIADAVLDYPGLLRSGVA